MIGTETNIVAVNSAAGDSPNGQATQPITLCPGRSYRFAMQYANFGDDLCTMTVRVGSKLVIDSAPINGPYNTVTDVSATFVAGPDDTAVFLRFEMNCPEEGRVIFDNFRVRPA